MEGDLRIYNRLSFANHEDNTIQGSQGNNESLEVLPIPDRYCGLPASHCRRDREVSTESPCHSFAFFIETLVNAACARILRNYAEVRYPLLGPPRLTDDQLRAAIDYIHDHIGESLELRSISQAASLSWWSVRQESG